MNSNLKKTLLIISISLFFFFILIFFLNIFFKGPIPYGSIFKKYSYHEIHRLLYLKKINKPKENKNNNFQNFTPSGKKVIYPCYENSNQYIEIYLDKHFFKNNKNDYYNYSDLILLGDSFLFGWCVNYNNTISGLLRNYFKFKILEISYPGTTIDTQFFLLKKYFKNKNLDKIIIFFYENNDFLFEKENLSKL